MIENRRSEIDALKARTEDMRAFLHIDAKRSELVELGKQSSHPDFWNDSQSASSTMSTINSYREEIELYESVLHQLEDLIATADLAYEEEDEDLAAEVETSLDALTSDIDTLEVSSWFTGDFDGEDAIVTILPGQGGLEAQDWTGMLFKMYQKYAEGKRWKIDVHDAPPGESIGLDRAIFTVRGKNAYGMLSSEQGVHRLVRISPTDLKKRRQTTFAGVTIVPKLPDDIIVEIRDEDIRIDVYRSSGPGGQSVNTTDSAVRITHIPSGIVVTCQNEKSQHKNKDAAMSILKARLFEEEKRRRAAELDDLRGPRQDITWGSQIRNYVMYPYQMVKDVRTGIETGNIDGVLDGDIEKFVIGYHRWKAAGSPLIETSNEGEARA